MKSVKQREGRARYELMMTIRCIGTKGRAILLFAQYFYKHIMYELLMIIPTYEFIYIMNFHYITTSFVILS